MRKIIVYTLSANTAEKLDKLVNDALAQHDELQGNRYVLNGLVHQTLVQYR